MRFVEVRSSQGTLQQRQLPRSLISRDVRSTSFIQSPPSKDQKQNTPLPRPYHLPVLLPAPFSSLYIITNSHPLDTAHIHCTCSRHMARPRQSRPLPTVKPGPYMWPTPWAFPQFWNAADVPAQWPPDSSIAVYHLQQGQVRRTSWGVQGRYYHEHAAPEYQYIWLPRLFPDLLPWPDHKTPGLNMERAIRGRWVRDRRLAKSTTKLSWRRGCVLPFVRLMILIYTNLNGHRGWPVVGKFDAILRYTNRQQFL